MCVKLHQPCNYSNCFAFHVAEPKYNGYQTSISVLRYEQNYICGSQSNPEHLSIHAFRNSSLFFLCRSQISGVQSRLLFVAENNSIHNGGGEIKRKKRNKNLQTLINSLSIQKRERDSLAIKMDWRFSRLHYNY